jgi:hypothetical protein
VSTLFIKNLILNIYNEDESFNLEAKKKPTFHEMQTFAFGNGNLQNLILIHQGLKACKLLGVQGQLKKKSGGKNKDARCKIWCTC